MSFPFTVSAVSADAPFVRLPGAIELNRDEALAVLDALDSAKTAARSAHEQRVSEAAILIIMRKLWDGFADILEMNGGHDV